MTMSDSEPEEDQPPKTDKRRIQRVKTCLLLGVLFFVTEHLGRKYDLDYIRISTYLNYAQKHLKIIWRLLGELYAVIASFLYKINLTELRQTMTDILVPSVEVVFSFTEFWKGVSDQAAKTSSTTYVAGGSLVMASIGYLYHREGLTLRFTTAAVMCLVLACWHGYDVHINASK